MPKPPQFDMSVEEVTAALRLMEENPIYVTKSAYRANVQLWPDHRISFVNSHISYLQTHPSVNPEHYLANLRLMLKKRG